MGVFQQSDGDQGQEGEVIPINWKIQMKRERMMRERRRFPRLLLDLPLEYRVLNVPYAHGGLVVNASEVGLLIQSIKNIPVGERLVTLVLFPKGFELASLEVLTEVVWKDIHRKDDWEGFHYGLNFVRTLDEDREKLKQLLSCQPSLEEISKFS